jgi:cytoskeletal protein RodZ
MQLSERNRLFRGLAMAIAALLLVAGAVFGSQAANDSQNKPDSNGNGSVESNNNNSESESPEASESEVEDAGESEVEDVEDASESPDANESEVEQADGPDDSSASPDESHSGSGGGQG